MNGKTDIIVVGTGASGLFYALNTPPNKRILMITKRAVDESDSYLAQGGICVLRDTDDYDSFFEDTLKAGHYENDRASVAVMIRSSPEIIKNLIDLGVTFEKETGNCSIPEKGPIPEPGFSTMKTSPEEKSPASYWPRSKNEPILPLLKTWRWWI